MFYTFDHTADIGLVITAPTLPELFAEAGRGLFSLIVANLDDVQRVDSRTLVISGEELEYRLFDFLNELLYLFEHEHWVGNAFEVSLAEDSVSVIAWGEPLDRTRHRLEHEVKAVTYHGLVVEQRDALWHAEVIFDI